MKKTYTITYRKDGSPQQIIEADFLKYDAGSVLLIKNEEGEKRVVAAVNMESVCSIVETPPLKS